jgi:hypothetical protein
MAYIVFDTSIRLNEIRIEQAGLSISEVIDAVSTAVESMEGVGWVDAAVHPGRADLSDAVTVYGPGLSVVADTPWWRTIQDRVEAVVDAAVWKCLDAAAIDRRRMRRNPLPLQVLPAGEATR